MTRSAPSLDTAALEAEVSRLAAELGEAQKRLNAARCAATGLQIGDVVLHRGIEHRISRIDARWDVKKPWLRGNQKKKDGTWGTREVHMYSDWTKP